MKVHHSIKDFKEKKHATILTIGTFDGVHIGHQKIIERLNQIKKKDKDRSAILTFFPHPRKILNQGNEVKWLNTMEEKIQLLDKFGLDHLIIEPFTKNFSELTAVSFVKDILVDQLYIKDLVIGYDHQFGKNREGNFEGLKKFGEVYNFKVEKITAQEIEDVSVSSTKIRIAIKEGNIKKANSYMGYNYLLTGKIIRGQGLGRKLNFPTINLHIDEDYKLIPKTGVYIVKTKRAQKTVFGIMNIGYRPTVDGQHKTIEVHLLDFKGDLYGKIMQIEVLKRLRNEQKFANLEDLILQIKKDEKTAREWISQQG